MGRASEREMESLSALSDLARGWWHTCFARCVRASARHGVKNRNSPSTFSGVWSGVWACGLRGGRAQNARLRLSGVHPILAFNVEHEDILKGHASCILRFDVFYFGVCRNGNGAKHAINFCVAVAEYLVGSR